MSHFQDTYSQIKAKEPDTEHVQQGYAERSLDTILQRETRDILKSDRMFCIKRRNVMVTKGADTRCETGDKRGYEETKIIYTPSTSRPNSHIYTNLIVISASNHEPTRAD